MEDSNNFPTKRICKIFHFTLVIIRQNNVENVIFSLGVQGLLVATIGFLINSLQPGVALMYPLKTSENL